MKGEKTMCTLVGDNKTEGLIVSKLYTHSRVHLIVAVKEALVLLPISFLVRIANYQVSWKLVLDKDQFVMTDSWGDNFPVTEQEDLTFLSKATFWRVGHDLFHFANKVEGMDWKDVWQALTGETYRFSLFQLNGMQISLLILWSSLTQEISLHVPRN